MASIFRAVQEIQARYEESLLEKRNVIGVAMGYKESGGQLTNEPAVVVLVQQKQPVEALTAADRVPDKIEDVTTDVYEIGHIQALQMAGPRGRFRPNVPTGVSMAHYKVTAGTLGAVVKDRRSGDMLLLSNTHVFANANEAMLGDPLLQPSSIDGGQNPADVVAKLERFIPLSYLQGDVLPPGPTTNIPEPTPEPEPETPSAGGVFDAVLLAVRRLFGGSSSTRTAQSSTAVGKASAQSAGTNAADCALARPVNTTMFSPPIRNIGMVTGTRPPALGMRVRKTGRTTDTTEGNVTLLNATIDVDYNTSKGPRTARFTNQVICSSMSQGGDSGALVVEAGTNRAVGLLFAGSQLASIFTPIDVVLNALDVDLM